MTLKTLLRYGYQKEDRIHRIINELSKLNDLLDYYTDLLMRMGIQLPRVRLPTLMTNDAENGLNVVNTNAVSVVRVQNETSVAEEIDYIAYAWIPPMQKREE